MITLQIGNPWTSSNIYKSPQMLSQTKIHKHDLDLTNKLAKVIAGLAKEIELTWRIESRQALVTSSKAIVRSMAFNYRISRSNLETKKKCTKISTPRTSNSDERFSFNVAKEQVHLPAQ